MSSSTAENLPPGIADLAMTGGRFLLMHTESAGCYYTLVLDRLLPPEPSTTRVWIELCPGTTELRGLGGCDGAGGQPARLSSRDLCER